MNTATSLSATSRAAFAGNRSSCSKSASGVLRGAVQGARDRAGAWVNGSSGVNAKQSTSRRLASIGQVKRSMSLRVNAGYGYGDAIAPDTTHTEEAFVVNLDRIAVGAYVSVSVRADVSPDAAVDALVAIVHAHMPGDVFVHWGLGSEEDDGSISAEAWECPPAELMPPGSRRVSNWASGAAVQSPIDLTTGTIEIPLPSRPGHGLAFVLYDQEKQCYYDHQGAAFFLDSALSSETARRATAAAKDQARAQETHMRAIAEAEASETARHNAEMARSRDEELRRREQRDREEREQREEEANIAAFDAAAAESARQNAADEAAAAERRRIAAEKQEQYEREMTEQANQQAQNQSAYDRFVNDPQNPFRDFTPARAAAARGEDVLPGMLQAATATMSPPAPPPGFVDPALAAGAAAFAPSASSGGGSGSGWDSASSSAATDHSYNPPPAPTPPAPAPTSVATQAPAASGAVVASHTIPLTTESGSSTGTCEVSVMATWPPSVRIECRAGGAADGHPLLLHWGVTDRRGGSWMSPQKELQSIPAGSRAPDAQSCESALENGVRVVEFAPVGPGATCMVMLVRTENCQEWLRETSGGDVFIDVAPALDAVRALGPPDGAQQQHQEQHHHQHHEQHRHEQQHHSPPPPPPPQPVDTGDHMALLSNWAGANVELKDHKGGKGDRHNQWNTDGLPDAARRIVENDRDSASYRQKLQKLEEVLCGGDAGSADFDALGYSAVYLFWVGVGAVACAEDGGHYRPNHHAEAASRIYQHIEAVENHASSQGGRYAEETRALIRRLHPRLPAFTAEFTQSVPLTRIRDIAHGKGDNNGRCREVRQEIKHTIQNKLHRCAGPEDLVATEKMLAKLTAPGTDYPEEFVEEFRIFHKELKDFFNASTVTDRIDKLLRENGDTPSSVRDAASAFSNAKAQCDAITASDGAELLGAIENALGALSQARRTFDWELTNGGLQGASPDQRQQWRLAEIGLEDYAFVLLSRGINALGAEQDPPRTEMSAIEQKAALVFLGAAADAVALSAGGGGGEFEQVAREAGELAIAANGMPPGGEDGALRSRAVAERARRAAEDHCAMLADLFDGRASSLGRALGIDGHTVEVFTEGQIRASVVFQSAKLASHLLRAARAATGEAGWDCLVPGEVKGARLVCVDRLLPTDTVIQSLSASDPAVVLVNSADGDEEVSTCGPGVLGILLCHALPHLSHLALRARQAKTPLVAIEDPNLANHARSLQNGGVHLVAQPGGNISLNACELGVQGGGGGGSAQLTRSAQALVADTSAAGQVVDLRDLGAAEWSRAVAIAGSKATACAQLSAMATDPNAGFSAPAGAVLPFGSMEDAARAAGADQRLALLVDALESVAGDATQTQQICDELQQLARSLRPSDEALSQLQRLFNQGDLVMVRSTGNAEDLAGLSAAGLYDSISNVNPHDSNVLASAVAEVWASLFTTRAVGSRAAAGVGQRDAAMAVLVQQMLIPEVSFILMTKHPMTNDANVAYAELALGHGETLASGAVRGTPWRMSMNRLVPGEARLDAVSSFGAALVPSPTGDGTLVSEPVNCASHWMTVDEGRRAELSQRLVVASDLIERKLGVVDGGGANGQPTHQDIEGCIASNGEVWIVQARPQP